MADAVQNHRGRRRAIVLFAASAMFVLLILISICRHRFVLFPLEYARIDENMLVPGTNISHLKEHLKSRGIEYSTIGNQLSFNVYNYDIAAINSYIFYWIVFDGDKVVSAKYEDIVEAF